MTKTTRWSLLFLLGEVLVEPGYQALDNITPMLWLGNQMAFVGVDHQLCFHSQSLQGMPKLVRLWRRTFTVTLPDQNERRRLDVFDEIDR